ncbi:MAG TPA: trypsin-like peptidase domain-containing protein [Candidatus Limnocylindrales bacterium]|jgi:S1-C subfamily serine protease|nr:trypsin-like peptidase domain-containing protein [Candidatus Limnocylindrales bacterium]
MSGPRHRHNPLRLLAIGLIIGLAAYWAGSRYGERIPAAVDAVKSPAPESPAAVSEARLDATETENVRIYRQASPAVGNIVTKTVEYDFFFNPVPVEGAGSGFLIDTDGHMLTNYHVVQGAQTIEVTLGDQSRYKAKLIGADTRNDIALIQIDAKGRQLTALPLGDSRNLLVGQRALAIGNPFGFQSTLTTGVISSLGRTVQTGENTFIDEAIQTDAAINRGNSGGPLLNSHGEVIGINSAIFAPTGTTAGIGFAIPINTAKRVAEDLITKGRVSRATLGVEGRALWPGLAEALNLNVDKGILIERVTPGGSAAKAGIRGGTRSVLAGLQELRIGGDVLVAVDGKPVASQMDLNLLLNRAKPGDTVKLSIVRDGKKMEVTVQLGQS